MKIDWQVTGLSNACSFHAERSILSAHFLHMQTLTSAKSPEMMKETTSALVIAVDRIMCISILAFSVKKNLALGTSFFQERMNLQREGPGRNHCADSLFGSSGTGGARVREGSVPFKPTSHLSIMGDDGQAGCFMCLKTRLNQPPSRNAWRPLMF